MGKRVQLRRLIWLALLLILAFAGLGYRLVDLQVLRHAELSAKAQENTQQEYLLEPRRGDILDAKGNLLATSVPVKRICADPSLIGPHAPEVARVLAPLLGLPEKELSVNLTPRFRTDDKGRVLTNRPVRFACLKHEVPEATWNKVQSAMDQLIFDEEKAPPTDNLSKEELAKRNALWKKQRAFCRNLRRQAIFAQNEHARFYPNQRLAAHVLGVATAEDRMVDDFPVRELKGREGVELTLDAKLAGQRGWRVTEADRRNRELVTLREQDVEPCDGLNVVLSIDSVIQHMVEEALAEAMTKYCPVSASGIVVRPRTGEILAMATLPNFDPNNLRGSSIDARRNRAITDAAEPGSTFKIVVVSGALNDSLVRLTDHYDCENGYWFFGGFPLRDHEKYGDLTVEQIVTKSSNIGAGKIGVKMGAERLYEYVRSFGFGDRTGIPLQGESWGIVHPVSKWSKVSVARIPMGQGLATTRLQMIMAMCAIANKGWLMRPMLVERLEDENHKVVAQYSPQRVRQVISEQTTRLMVQALKTVASPGGTAPSAALEHYTVAGKTGTAQKPDVHGYSHERFFSSFIGFFPADNPELCISVTLDEPDKKRGYYGGAVCGPIFKKIAESAANYLNLRPEDADTVSGPEGVPAPLESRTLKTAAARP